MIFIFVPNIQKFVVRTGESTSTVGGLGRAYGFKSIEDAKKFASIKFKLGDVEFVSVDWVN